DEDREKALTALERPSDVASDVLGRDVRRDACLPLLRATWPRDLDFHQYAALLGEADAAIAAPGGPLSPYLAGEAEIVANFLLSRRGDRWVPLGLRTAKIAVRHGPGHAAAWRLLGAAYGRSSDYERSLAALDKAVGLEPDNMLNESNRAECLILL